MKKTKYNNMQIVKYISALLFSGVLVLLLLKTNFFDYIDKFTLLEQTHPAYLSLLSLQTEHHVLDAALADDNPNLIISNVSSYDSGLGYTVTVGPDGSIAFMGTNNSDVPSFIKLTPDSFTLPSGTYILSDGDASINSGIFLRFYGSKYEIGGNTTYSDVISLPSSGVINWDNSEFDHACIDIMITPHFSSKKVVFYPMLRNTEAKESSYSPYILTNDAIDYGSNNFLTYFQYSTTKNDLNTISAADISLFLRYISNTNGGDWSTIRFPDGTGIQLKNNSLKNMYYGKLDSAGRVLAPKSKVKFDKKGTYCANTDGSSIGPTSFETGIGGLSVVDSIPNNLCEINDIYTYLEALNTPSYTTFITIKDEGVGALNNKLNNELSALGVQTQLNKVNGDGISRSYYQNSYYAILIPGQSTIEAIDTKTLTKSGFLTDGASYTISSSGFSSGAPNASIIINNSEYCTNQRGMNFVVYDNATHQVVDSVSFDTCIGLTCRRAHDFVVWTN